MARLSKFVLSIFSKFIHQGMRIAFDAVNSKEKLFTHYFRRRIGVPLKFSLYSIGLLGFAPNKPIDSNPSWTTEKNIVHKIALAQIALKDGNFEKAETILNAALNISDQTQTVGVTCIYDMLATLAYRQGEMKKAENLLIQVINKLKEMGLAYEDNTIINFSLKLARLYDKKGDKTSAENGFKKCIEIQKQKYSSGRVDEESVMLLINTLFWYGKFLAQHGRYAEAKRSFDNAYTLSANTETLETNQIMVMLYNISEMSFATGDLEGALKHLLNAIIIGRKTNSPDLPNFYTKIGIIYLKLGIFNEAKQWCESGKKYARRMRDKNLVGEAENCLKKVQSILQIKK